MDRGCKQIVRGPLPWPAAVVQGWGEQGPQGRKHSANQLDLKNIALAGHHLVQHGIDEESDEQSRD
jgi:hypothetical protein